MKDLTVIVPVHEYNETVENLLQRAFESLKEADKENECEVIIVTPIDDMKFPTYHPNLKVVVSKKGDFCTQINTAVKACTTKYFSILEFDDVYTPMWFKNVEKQIQNGDDISVYLPLTEVVDFKNQDKGPIGYVNEAVWASSFSDVIGYLDIDSLMAYMNFNATGGVFNKEDFETIGGLKPSIKLSFWYEFLLRSIHNGKKVYVIPKVGYQHYISRPDSVSDMYNKTMKSEEADWWIELAQKEYFYKKDRNKTYEE